MKGGLSGMSRYEDELNAKLNTHRNFSVGEKVKVPHFPYKEYFAGETFEVLDVEPSKVNYYPRCNCRPRWPTVDEEAWLEGKLHHVDCRSVQHVTPQRVTLAVFRKRFVTDGDMLAHA